jgi:hypothetical protein
MKTKVEALLKWGKILDLGWWHEKKKFRKVGV